MGGPHRHIGINFAWGKDIYSKKYGTYVVYIITLKYIGSAQLNCRCFLAIHHLGRGPAQDGTYDIILWYV